MGLTGQPSAWGRAGWSPSGKGRLTAAFLHGYGLLEKARAMGQLGRCPAFSGSLEETVLHLFWILLASPLLGAGLAGLLKVLSNT